MTRADDERLLSMLAMHERGVRSATIATRHGLTQRQAAASIARLQRDDSAHDPEAVHHWAAVQRRRKTT